MIERIIGLVACIMCAIPFSIIAHYEKDSSVPITFWSGDKSLPAKLKNIPAYNREMAALYKKCAIAFLLAGLGCLIHMAFGVTLIILESTVGIYAVYRKYKIILNKYS